MLLDNYKKTRKNIIGKCICPIIFAPVKLIYNNPTDNNFFTELMKPKTIQKHMTIISIPHTYTSLRNLN